MAGRARATPQAAAEWAEGLSSTDLQVDAMVQVVRTWARRDHAAAGEWINQFNPSLDMDTVIQAYIERIERRHPDEALVFAQRVTDQAKRESTVARLQDRMEKQRQVTESRRSTRR